MPAACTGTSTSSSEELLDCEAAKPSRNGILKHGTTSRRGTIIDSVKETLEEQKQSLWAMVVQLYGRLKLRYILPAVGLIIYSCIGGVIFMYAERDNDLNNRRERYNETRLKVEKAIRQVLWRAAEIESMPRSVRARELRTALLWLSEQAGAEWEPVAESASPWDFWGSLFFAGTVYTTIGYGNYSPVTTGGRIAVVFYALFGIPMVLSILNDLGRLMIVCMKVSWHHICRWFKQASRHCQLRFVKRKLSALVDEADFENTDGETLPISGALLVFAFWMCLCAGLFVMIEPSWTFAECLYFFFVSLTTIGFGDMVPHDTRYAPITIPLLILGLSVISMCINVIQMRIELLFRNLAQSIDSEYKSGQTGEQSLMTATGGSLGVLQLYRRQSPADKVLYKMMNKNLKGVLEQRFEHCAKMRNTAVQATVSMTCDTGCQWDEEDEDAKRKKARKYIYNCDD